jgi:hypothetical protein
MRIPAGLAAPDPVPLIVRTDLSRVLAVERLERAIQERRYSMPWRTSRGFFRLGGSIANDRITMKARPYVTPGWIAGYGAMTLVLLGQVAPRDGGSEIRGTVTAPVSWMALAVLGVVLIAWTVFGISSNGSTLPVWTFFVVGSLFALVAGLWIIRRNQRMALRNVDELARVIRSVVAEPPPAAG